MTKRKNKNNLFCISIYMCVRAMPTSPLMWNLPPPCHALHLPPAFQRQPIAKTAPNKKPDFQKESGLSIALRQYRTKSVWRLCTPSACKFPFRACFVSSRTHLACIFSEIFRENTRKSTKDFLRFSLHLSKNLTTQSAYVRYETDSHISQKCSWIHPVFTPLFVSSDEKFDDASVAQSLCGIA